MKEFSFPSTTKNEKRRNNKYNFQQGDGVMRFTKAHHHSISRQQLSNHFIGGDNDIDWSGERDLTVVLKSARTQIEPSPMHLHQQTHQYKGTLEQVLRSPMEAKKVVTAGHDIRRPTVSQPAQKRLRTMRDSAADRSLPSLAAANDGAQICMSPWPISPPQDAGSRRRLEQ